MLKRGSVLKLLIILFVLLFAFGCSDSSGGDGNSSTSGKYDVPVAYRGQWLYAHSAGEVFLGAKTNLELEYTDGNIITVKGKGVNEADNHLVRAGISNVQLHGNIEELASVASIQSVNSKRTSAIGGMDVVLKNVTDPNIREQVKTDDNGNFSIDGIPSGVYEIVVDNITIKTELGDSDNDVGVVTVVKSGCNFKSSVVMQDKFLYGNYTVYRGVVRIANVGNSECTGLMYEITPVDDRYIAYFSFDRMHGTLPSGYFASIPIVVSFEYLDDPELLIPFDIKLRDVFGGQWSDRFRLKVYSDVLTVHFHSERQLRGYIVIPGHIPYSFSTTRRGTNIYFDADIKLPNIPNKEHILVLSNPDISYETFYSMGIDVPANDSRRLTDNLDKGNNTTESAIKLNDESKADGYLYRGALHTYKVVMTELNKPVALSIDRIGWFYGEDSMWENVKRILYKGKTATFSIAIKNSGSFAAEGVSTILSLTDPYITVTNLSDCTPVDIGGRRTVDTNGYDSRSASSWNYLRSDTGCFQATVSDDAPDNYIATVTATMTDRFGNVWTDTFDVSTEHTVDLSVVGVSPFYDTTNFFYRTVGNGDGVLNKGETANFNIGVKNSGFLRVTFVYLALSTADPYVTITERLGTSPYISSLDRGQTADNRGRDSAHPNYLSLSDALRGDFQIKVANDAPDNHVVTVTATMTKGKDTWTDTFDITIYP